MPGSIARMAGVFGIMVLLGIAFATGTVPAGITADFARWYLIFPQIGLILATLAGIALYWGRRGGGRVAASVGMLGIFALGGLLATADLIGRARVAVAQEVSHAELVGVRDTLAGLAGDCAVLPRYREPHDRGWPAHGSDSTNHWNTPKS